jgi:hypothetical protein
MKKILPQDIMSFLKREIQPLEDSMSGDGYRVAAYLKDGTFLPCVVFRNADKTIDLAIKRFKEEQTGRSIFTKSSGLGYREIVKLFVTGGNCVNHYDIAKVEKSRHAFPIDVIKQIRGETKMGWTGFVGKMKDGKHFAFGTDWHLSFFNMPDNYKAEDIEEIINHTYIDEQGLLKSYHSPDVYEIFKKSMVYESKPFFECYVDEL